MLNVKIQVCSQYYDSLSEAEKQTKTAKHLWAAIEVAKKLSKKVNELDARCQELYLECEGEDE